ncbi:MAG: hypothetical protein FJX15_14940 [Alphaproteobacteria bacterium]|nr:hypothetical protein [Alphaproteobacteria bacterium]
MEDEFLRLFGLQELLVSRANLVGRSHILAKQTQFVVHGYGAVFRPDPSGRPGKGGGDRNHDRTLVSRKKAVARHEVPIAFKEGDPLPDCALNVSPFGGFGGRVNQRHQIAERRIKIGVVAWMVADGFDQRVFQSRGQHVAAGMSRSLLKSEQRASLVERLCCPRGIGKIRAG